MAGHVRKRHPKLFKRLTIGGSIFGLISVISFVAFLVLDIVGVYPFITDELRTYTATYVSDGAVVDQATYRRGEVINKPSIPEKQADGEKNYIFIGWDLTGEGIPDVLPYRAYYSYTARAVFFGFGDFNLSLEDLMKMDLETLLNLLEKLNIDWEEFMKMFHLSPEDLMNLLSKNKILSFYADSSKYVSYFRTTSYGDFNYNKKKFNNPSMYDPNLISSNSVNPLRYTADKLYSASMLGMLPEEFGFANYDITYNTKRSPYPIPDCEIGKGSSDEVVKSDAYLLTKPVDKKYYSQAAYCPAFRDVIDILKIAGYSTSAITQDEREYFKYAKEHYLSVPKQYDSLISEIIAKEEWEANDYFYVDEVGKYVESRGALCMLPDEEGHWHKNKDPIVGLIESEKGSDFDFNTLAVMIFRKLGIPARMVQGYLVPEVAQGYNEITLLNQHYWCEIYAENVGWMICDCTNGEDLIGFNPYGGSYNTDENPISDPTDDPPIDPDVPVDEPGDVTHDLSGEVSTTGPGDKTSEEGYDLFSFTSSYEGTSYFKSRIYNNYLPNGVWGIKDEYDSYGLYENLNSPNTYTFKIASKLYDSKNVTIKYLQNMTYGLAPAYCSALGSKANYHTDMNVSEQIEANFSETFTETYVPLTSNDLKRMSAKGHLSTIDKNREENYRNYVYQSYLSYDSYSYQSAFDNLRNTYLNGVYDKEDLIVATYEMFKNNFSYNVNYSPYAESDPVIGFLNRREGICNNFATVSTLFYRYLGIPSRFVTGYGAASQGAGKTTVVSNYNAHAWTEVYLDGVGWITVDTTGFDDGHSSGEGYGSGFGGGGANQFEPIISKQILHVDYDANCPLNYTEYEYKGVTYKDYFKNYDGQPLATGWVTVSNSYDVQPGHQLIIDDSMLAPLGTNVPGFYESTVSVRVIETATGDDITSKYYTIDDPGFLFEISPIEILNVNVNFTNTTVSQETICDFNSYSVNYSMSGQLISGHTVYFIPEVDPSSIPSEGEFTVYGHIVVRDADGNDVTDLYSFDSLEYPVVSLD